VVAVGLVPSPPLLGVPAPAAFLPCLMSGPFDHGVAGTAGTAMAASDGTVVVTVCLTVLTLGTAWQP
jgi:hypothetical protein